MSPTRNPSFSRRGAALGFGARAKGWAWLVSAVVGAAGLQSARWARAEAELERRLTDLHGQGVLAGGDVDALAPSASAARLAQGMRVLDKWLFEHARDGATAGAPWSWRPEHRRRLELALAPAEPFFRQADALLGGTDAAELRARNEMLEGVLEPPAHRRAWVRLLCARAVLDVSREGGSAGAARRLAQALDLARLLGARTSWELLSRQSLEALALAALQQILREGQGDAAQMRGAIEPRLRAASGIAGIDAALAGDLRLWIERREHALAGAGWTALLTRPGALERQIATLRSFESARLLAHLPEWEHARWLREGRAGAAPGPSDGHDASWASVVEAWRAHQSAVALARVALGLAHWRQDHGSWPEDLQLLRTHFDGEVPLDPCSAKPIPWSPSLARLGPTAFSARTGSSAREERQLHLWPLNAR